ncbi:glycosyltransferase family 4 protein [Micrococcus luteus]|uniref:glycosyltransferase family 4 protein n=1 Tax=Micrococcus luteus TaxID=1270 RepID=UPI0029D8FC2C|nr:glycosyltransferase family 4 protein [Micrococcus luteus]MCV7633458.1 glycosyltransferase family 4 protein [Micrococcus luteus]
MDLGYLSPSSLWSTPDGLAMDARAWESVEEMARSHEGRFIVASPGFTRAPATPVGCVALDIVSPAFDVVAVEPTAEGVDSLDLDAILALHSRSTAGLARARTPVVLTSEVTYGIRLGIHRASLSGLPLARAAAGLLRQEAGLLRQVLWAASLQANGPAAARAYGRLTEDALAFHDSRIRHAEVEAAATTPGWEGGPLRIGFSGRLDPIKGPGFAIALAKRAKEDGLPVELHVFGAGPLEAELRSSAGSNVVSRGFADFHEQWVPAVREEVDVMVLPHVQGDPSCTYFEALGCGTPILAFANQTSTYIAEERGAGWVVPQRDVEAMLQVLREILRDPRKLHDARAAGIALMRTHHFEATTRSRLRHLAQHAA